MHISQKGLDCEGVELSSRTSNIVKEHRYTLGGAGVLTYFKAQMLHFVHIWGVAPTSAEGSSNFSRVGGVLASGSESTVANPEKIKGIFLVKTN